MHKAIKAFVDASPGRSVDVEWKPYQIDPNTTKQGSTFGDYCQRRWGTSDPSWVHRLKSEGRKDGANFGNFKWVPNTSRAHQLVHYCASKGISSTDRVNALLFCAEYEDGENISLVESLVGIGQKAADEGGTAIDAEELRNYLTSEEGKQEVEKEIDFGRRKYGIRGVPHFIVSATGDDSNKAAHRPYSFSGAQSSDTFVEVFEELAE